MPRRCINGVELHYEIEGSGPPLILVHGSWDGHEVWSEVARRMSARFRVISYDRRGHSRSERPSGPRVRRQDEDDLAGIIEAIAGEPAYVAANSFGGIISLGLVGRRPELVRALAVHEPPALSAVNGGELAELVASVLAGLSQVLAEIESGAAETATRRFVEIALGPGAWEHIPDDFRRALVANAPAFLAEQRDPDAFPLDLGVVGRSGLPILLTKGTESPQWLQLLLDHVATCLPGAETAAIPGAGHVPHETNPAEYVDVLEAFVGSDAAIAA